MTVKTKAKSRILDAVHETAADLHRLGFIDKRKRKEGQTTVSGTTLTFCNLSQKNIHFVLVNVMSVYFTNMTTPAHTCVYGYEPCTQTCQMGFLFMLKNQRQ